MNWGHLLERAENVFYTNILADLASILVVILYMLHRGKNRCARFLVWMAGSFLLQSLLVEWVASQAVKNAVRSRIAHDSLYVYLGIELTCCLLFIRCHTRPVIAKKVLLWGVILFIPYMFYYWFSNPLDTGFSSNILTAEGFLIILACAWFFIEFNDRQARPKPVYRAGILEHYRYAGVVYGDYAGVPAGELFYSQQGGIVLPVVHCNNLCYRPAIYTFALTIARGRNRGK